MCHTPRQFHQRWGDSKNAHYQLDILCSSFLQVLFFGFLIWHLYQVDLCTNYKQMDTVPGLTIPLTLTKTIKPHDPLNMFDLLKIKLFGHQPIAKISDQLLDTLIERDFKSEAAIVRTKLNTIDSNSKAGQNRIAAGILKLADKNFGALDKLIEKANTDSRDIFMCAEYPRSAKVSFDDQDKKQMKQIYIDDFIEFSNWLKV